MAAAPNPRLIPNPLRPFDTTRLSFRAVRGPEDLPLFLAIGHDQPGFMNSNLSNAALPSPADGTKFMKSVAEDSLLGATIWLKSTPESPASSGQQHLTSEWGTAIGEIHLSRLPSDAQHHRWTEIGIDILPEFQGRGYGREAIEWALDYAFRRAGLHRMRIRAFEWNVGAVKLYEKVGFQVEGKEREALWHEGRWWDGISFGMLDREWVGMQSAMKKDEGSQEERRRTSRAIRIEGGENQLI
ncbi:hypothetical protein N0V95_003273 [Ascochyta clinopodiicola]|nr:hypothetical protein N0V95_003273 [Ascochyta clinopodiicola]